MEILKNQFSQQLPFVRESLRDADFIAIDAEFTGLMPSNALTSNFDDLPTRYKKICDAVKEFTIIQYGVCAFKKSQDGKFIAKPFNFYIFGENTETVTSHRAFLSSADSLAFLRSNHFDFNKWIESGIPFYNFSEERTTYKNAKGVSHFSNRDAIDISNLNKSSMSFVTNLRADIKEWLQMSSHEPLLVQVNSTHHRKLVHKEIQDSQYNGFLQAKDRDSKHMTISKMTIEERRTISSSSRIDTLNFRCVIEAVKESNCPVIVHNGMLDICHTVDQFWEYLPADIKEFKNVIKDMWPCIVDTKYLSEHHPAIKKLFSSTALNPLYETVSAEMENDGPKIILAEGFTRYGKDKEAQHEAGYDAYMTGVVYLGLAVYIEEWAASKKATLESLADLENDGSTKEPDHIQEESAVAPRFLFGANELTKYYNKIYLMRSDIPYIDLNNDEPEPEKKVMNLFYLTDIPNALRDAGIAALYPELQPFSVQWVNANTAWLSVKHQNQIPSLKEGKLGINRVAPFLSNGAQATKGASLCITEKAADMHLIRFDTWRELNKKGDDPSSYSATDTASPSTNGSAKQTETDITESATTRHPALATPSGSRDKAAVVYEQDIYTGGASYDDLLIPIPASFKRNSKRERDLNQESSMLKEVKRQK